MNIAQQRLFKQRLFGDKFEKPEEVISWLGAVQAQDFPAAKWGLGIRIKNTTDQSVEQAFNEGRFLRTHVMRPTWHFVLPEDIVWMQELTAEKVKSQMVGYNRKLELTDEIFAKGAEVIVDSLKGRNYLTRQQLKVELEKVGIETDVQRLAHLVFWPELDGIICSGPKVGKQLTYALVAERAPQARRLSREESLARLTLKYFSNHGPAQIQDFSWWSGLNQKEVVEGLDSNKDLLQKEVVNGKTYWFSNKSEEKVGPKAHLLSIYDEYVIAYKDRSALSTKKDIERMLSLGNSLTSVVIIDGKAAGTWKRVLKKDTIDLGLNLFRDPSEQKRSLLRQAAAAYGRFLEKEVVLT